MDGFASSERRVSPRSRILMRMPYSAAWSLMGPESRVVPSLSCVIERFSNQACQKVSRCPFTRMTYLIRLCSVRMTFRRLRRRIPSRQVEHSSQKDTRRILSCVERRSEKRSADGSQKDIFGSQKDTLPLAWIGAILDMSG